MYDDKAMPGPGDPATWGDASPDLDTSYDDWCAARLPELLANNEFELLECAWESLPDHCLAWCKLLVSNPAFSPMKLSQFRREVRNTPPECVEHELKSGGITSEAAISLAVTAGPDAMVTWPPRIRKAALALREQVMYAAPGWWWVRERYDDERAEAERQANCPCRNTAEGCVC